MHLPLRRKPVDATTVTAESFVSTVTGPDIVLVDSRARSHR